MLPITSGFMHSNLRAHLAPRVNRFILALIGLSILILLSPSTIMAQQCQVYVNSSDGSDSNSGGLSSPYRTLSKGWNAISSGEDLCVAAGSYGSDGQGEFLVFDGKDDVTFHIIPFGGETGVKIAFQTVTFGSRTTWKGANSSLQFGSMELGADSTKVIEFLEGTVTFDLPDVVLESTVQEIVFTNSTVAGNFSVVGSEAVVRYQNNQPIDNARFIPGLDSVFENEASLVFPTLVDWTGQRIVQSGSGEMIFAAGLRWLSAETIFEQNAACGCQARVQGGLELGDSSSSFVVTGSLLVLDSLFTSSQGASLDLLRGSLVIETVSEASHDRLQVTVRDGNSVIGTPGVVNHLPARIEVSGQLALNSELSLSGAELKANRLLSNLSGAQIEFREAFGELDVESVDSLDVLIQAESYAHLGRTSGELIVESDLFLEGATKVRLLTVGNAGKVFFSENLEVGGLSSAGALVSNNESFLMISDDLAISHHPQSSLSALILLESFDQASFEGDFSLVDWKLTSWAKDGLLFASSLPDVEVRSGRLNVSHLNSEATVLSDIEIVGGSLVLSGSDFSLIGNLYVSSDASFNLASQSPLGINGTILPSSGSINFGNAGIKTLDSSLLRIESAIMVDSISMNSPRARIEIASTPNLVKSLALGEGILFLNDGSSVDVESDLIREEANIVSEGNGALRLVSTDTLTVQGFSDSLLPNLHIDAPVILNDDVVFVDGDLLIGPEASIYAASGARLGIRGDFRANQATISMRDVESLNVSGDLEINSSFLDIRGIEIYVDGKMTVHNSNTIDNIALLSGSTFEITESVIETDFMSLKALGINEITGDGMIDISRRLTISSGSIVVHDGEVLKVTDGELRIDGSVEGTNYITLEGSTSTWSGTGVFSHLALNLTDPSSTAHFEGDSLTVGSLLFMNGGINAGGAHVTGSGSPAKNKLVFYLESTDTQDSWNEKRIANYASIDGDFSITIEGEVSDYFTFPPFLNELGIIDLKIATRDISNDPGLYGISISHNLLVEGFLAVARDTRIRLSGTITLVGQGRFHEIQGHILGGVLQSSGLGSTLKGDLAMRLDELHVLSSGTLQDIYDVGFMQIDTADILWVNANRFAVNSSGFDIDGSNLSLSDVFIDNVGNSNSISGSRIDFTNSNISFNQPGVLLINDSDFVISSSSVTPFSISSSLSINSNSVLPGFLVGSGGSVLLQNNLSATGKVFLDNSTMATNGYSFTLRHGQVSVGENVTITGDPDTNLDRIIFSGETNSWSGSASLQNIGIQVVDSHLEVSKPHGDGAPCFLSAFGGSLTIINSELSLIDCDVVIESSLPEPVAIDNSRVTTTLQQPPNINLDTWILDDENWAELIIRTSEESRVRFSGNTRIDNLTIANGVHLIAADQPIHIHGRFAFGRTASSTIIDGSTSIGLQKGAHIVREGMGELIGNILFDSGHTIAYTIKDKRSFEADFLSGRLFVSGTELPDVVDNFILQLDFSTTYDASLQIRKSVEIEVAAFLGGTFNYSKDSTLLFGDNSLLWIRDTSQYSKPMIPSFRPNSVSRLIYDTDRESFLAIPTHVERIDISLLSSSSALSIGAAISADSLLFSGTDKNSIVRLNGNSVSSARYLSVVGTSIISRKRAELTFGGRAFIDHNSSLEDNLIINSSADMTVEGAVSVLSFISEADLTLDTMQFNPLQITARRTAQKWSLSDELELDYLIIDLPEAAALTLTSTKDINVIVKQRLEMISGGIIGSSTSILPKQFDFTPMNTFLFGRIVMPFEAGEPLYFSLPVRIQDRYFTTTFEVPDALPAETVLSLSSVYNSFSLESGLPLFGTDDTAYRGSTGYSLSVHSSTTYPERIKLNAKLESNTGSSHLAILDRWNWAIPGSGLISSADRSEHTYTNVLGALSSKGSLWTVIIPEADFAYRATSQLYNFGDDIIDIDFLGVFISLPELAATPELNWAWNSDSDIFDGDLPGLTRLVNSTHSKIVIDRDMKARTLTSIIDDTRVLYQPLSNDERLEISCSFCELPSLKPISGELLSLGFLSEEYSLDISSEANTTSFNIQASKISDLLFVETPDILHYYDEFGDRISAVVTTLVENKPSSERGVGRYDLFPNPMKNDLTISCEDMADSFTQVSVFDSLGRQVGNVKMTQPSCYFNLNGNTSLRLSAGHYFVQLSNSNRTLATRIVTKLR